MMVLYGAQVVDENSGAILFVAPQLFPNYLEAHKEGLDLRDSFNEKVELRVTCRVEVFRYMLMADSYAIKDILKQEREQLLPRTQKKRPPRGEELPF